MKLLASYRPIVCSVVAASFAVAGHGCSGWQMRSPFVKVTAERKSGPDQLTPTQIQSELMSYTDTFTSRVAQAWNQIAAEGRRLSSPQGLAAPDAGSDRGSNLRRAALEGKIASVSAALSIASSPNPTVALGDMITMVTLQRMVLEGEPAQKLYGPELGAMIVEVYEDQEEKAWNIARRAMTPEQQDELKQLIAEWRADNPNATYVANVRLEDFAARRQYAVAAPTHSSGSLLSLIGLDPLAGLDPAQREVQKSRLLAERVFFYASRSPQLMKWQVESLYQDLLRAPEFKQALGSFERATDSAGEFAKAAKQLPELVARERSEAIDQLFARLDQERHETLEEIDHRLSAQRQAIIADLDKVEGPLREGLQEYRKAADATDRAAASLKGAITSMDLLVGRFGAGRSGGEQGPPDPNAKSGLENYQDAVTKTAEAAERLSTLTRDLNNLLASPSLAAEPKVLAQTVADAQARSQGVIDYAFKRLLVLVLIAPVWAFATAWGYHAVKRRSLGRA